ncbi:hypothetical protein L9F63_015468, partial [Diploptera punctata]
QSLKDTWPRVLSEDESDSNSSSNCYSFDKCDRSPVSKGILLQSKPTKHYFKFKKPGTHSPAGKRETQWSKDFRV